MSSPDWSVQLEVARASLREHADALSKYHETYNDDGTPRNANQGMPLDMHHTTLEGLESACMRLEDEVADLLAAGQPG